MLVYRPELDRWESPFTLQGVSDKNCHVLFCLSSGLNKFHSTVVKRYYPPEQTAEESLCDGYEKSDSNITQQNVATYNETAKDQQQATTLTAYIENDESTLKMLKKRAVKQSRDGEKYAHSRQKGFFGLINRGDFTAMQEANWAGHRLYRARFVDEVETKEHLSRLKNRGWSSWNSTPKQVWSLMHLPSNEHGSNINSSSLQVMGQSGFSSATFLRPIHN